MQSLNELCDPYFFDGMWSWRRLQNFNFALQLTIRGHTRLKAINARLERTLAAIRAGRFES